MDYDLVIRGGVIVDGSGEPSFKGDVAIVDDRIVAIGNVGGGGSEEIDADGHVVAPGFVDAHTHMDAQVFWDELGMPACWHGVTTAVMGNCGFTVAPVHADRRDLVVRSLERAEDMPGDALTNGLPWSWESFAEFLDAVAATPKGLNYAASVGHSALRTWAMGERAFDSTATNDDLELMAMGLRSALRAGAAGFTTSRSVAHATSDGRPVASRCADWREIAHLVGIVGHDSNAVFQLAPERVHGPEERDDFLRRLETLALDSGVPVVFGLFATPRLPQPSTELIDRTVERGGEMWALTHCRGVVSAQSFLTRLAFDVLPEWASVRQQQLSAQRSLLHDPDIRNRLVESAHTGDYGVAFGPEARKPDFDKVRILRHPYPPHPTLSEVALQRGVDPVEAMIDVALESDFDVFFLQELVTQDDDALLRLMAHPRTAMGFSDSGAHLSQIFDSSIYSYLLGYWVREREAIPLEAAIRMITSIPATIWRLRDRGRLAIGYAADLTIFDPTKVGPQLPTVVADVPGGSRRIEQLADGFLATVVNGTVLTCSGHATEARPGRLLRASSTKL